MTKYFEMQINYTNKNGKQECCAFFVPKDSIKSSSSEKMEITLPDSINTGNLYGVSLDILATLLK